MTDPINEAADSGQQAGDRLAQGLEAIRRVLKTLPGTPGVYRMLDGKGDALYVGKARSLKSRVASYTHIADLPNRLRRMVSETVRMEFVLTHTEVEALLLESNLIKRLMPRYNVLLRDDKSFPYIEIKGGHEFPQLTKHRGARDPKGEYFGPFASAGAVNRTLIALQKAFLLRSCGDSFFSGRTRPCLLHQIKRCSAPCAGRITPEAYERLLAEARRFLEGRSHDVQSELSERMQAASDALDFEAAAMIRDRIRALTHVQVQQDVNVDCVTDADIVAAYQAGGQTSIQVFFFRGGQNWGNRAYFPAHERSLGLEEVLGSFLALFYDGKPPPRQILLSHGPAEAALIQEALSLRAGGKVELLVPKRGDKARLVAQALTNAREALGRRLAESSAQTKLLEGVANLFGLEGPLMRVEVYDNSHIQGTDAVGGMIVAGPEGFVKNAYRKFNMKVDTGDDYAMMREMLSRRFARALKEDPAREQGSWPDLVLIDGGAGQLSAAREVLDELGLTDLGLAAIAKGPDRNAGRERFFLPDREAFSLDPRDPVLYFLQRLRDEAHRFAIGTHRARRSKTLVQSPLDEVPGVGATRKRALLHHFGSARLVSRAGLGELERVDGISKAVAKKIYEHFHQGD